MPNHALTPHTSGTTLSAQARYAAGVLEILQCHFENKPIRNEYLIVKGGGLAGAGAHAYKEGNATDGSGDAAKYQKKINNKTIIRNRFQNLTQKTVLTHCSIFSEPGTVGDSLCLAGLIKCAWEFVEGEVLNDFNFHNKMKK